MQWRGESERRRTFQRGEEGKPRLRRDVGTMEKLK